MRFRRVPVRTLGKVIAFALLALVFTMGLGVKIGNMRLFSHNISLSAQFANASGVFKGDAVKLAGVDVGRVEGTEIQNGLAIVKFNVDESVKLTSNSLIAIRWRNVLGQRFLYIYPGDGRGQTLKDGSTIPVTHTQDAGDIGQFLNELGPILRAIDPDKANAFLDSVNGALAGNEAAVRQLVTEGSGLAARLAQMDSQIQSLIGSSDTILATYANQSQAIARIIDDLDQLGARLGGMTGDINSVLDNFSVVQQRLDQLLKDNRTNIDVDLANLQSVSQTLSKNRANLNTTLCTLPAGVAGYFQTTSWGEWFNVRVVKVTVKDPNGKIVASEQEPDRTKPAPAPYQRCAGQAGGDASSTSATTKSSTSSTGLDSSGFGTLGDFLGNVVGGS